MNDKGKIIKSFILGFFLGGAVLYTGLHFCRHYWRGHAFGGWSRERHSEKFLKKLTRKLDLSAEQTTQVEKILESNRLKLKGLKETGRQQFHAIRNTINAEIRAVLNPGQQSKFDNILEDFEKRRKKWEEKRDKKR